MQQILELNLDASNASAIQQPGEQNIGNYYVENFTVVNSLKATKIALFRHPIERLLSGWNHLFQDRCDNPCGKHPVCFKNLSLF